MVAELQLGLKWHAQGKSGDGLTPATVNWATRMANGSDISPEKARKMRAWLARHESDKKGEGFYPDQNGYPSAGRVAWALWAGDAGVTFSNKIVSQMDKADEEQKSHNLQYQKRTAIWLRYIEKTQKPAETKLQTAFNKYMKGAKKRYIARIKEQKNYNGSITKGIDYFKIMAAAEEEVILKDFLKGTPDKMVNGRLIKGKPGAYQGTWQKTGKSMLKRLLKLGNVQEPSDLFFGEQFYLDKILDQAVKEIVTTTSKKVQKKVVDGVKEGLTIDQIALNISDQGLKTDPIFGYARARTIARTESTRIISGAQNRSFVKAKEEYGLTVKKAWVANRDSRTRDLHLDLEAKYGRDDQAIDVNAEFIIDSYSAQNPGEFGAPEMDINCRCTVIPIVN
mgnify:CR=1 FL=1